jgi:phage shock protein PspC (stress-responsive transcriptional regulator)
VVSRLYRNKDEKVIAGVCSGLSDYFQIDVAIIRVIFLTTALIWGISILIYIFCWIAMPLKSHQQTVDNPLESMETEEQKKERSGSSKRSKEILAIILIMIGIFATLDNLFTWFYGRMWLPMILIILGLLILIYGSRNGKSISKETQNE